MGPAPHYVICPVTFITPPLKLLINHLFGYFVCSLDLVLNEKDRERERAKEGDVT